MQVNDFKNIQEAIKYEVLQDEKEYLKLLKVVGNNQKYDFSSQLSIYNKEPEARACATFEMWKKYFGRVVMRGQKGIPILVGSDVNQRISYIFDISQTTSMDSSNVDISLLFISRSFFRFSFSFISLISDISFIAYIIIKEKKNNQKCLLKYSTKEYLVTNMVKIYNTNLQIKLNLLSFIFFIHNEKSLNIFILFSSLKSININSTHCLY